MRKHLLILGFALFAQLPVQAQAVTLDAYGQRLFFNVFTDKPDAAIQDFLKFNIPSLLDKKNVAVRAPGNGNGFVAESHGFIFLKHPGLQAPFNSGRLEFDCRRYNDERGVVAEKARLWFSFDTQPDAETTFGQIVTALQPLSTKHRVNTVDGSFVGDFTDEKATHGFYRARLVLTSDLIDKNRYLLLCEFESK